MFNTLRPELIRRLLGESAIVESLFPGRFRLSIHDATVPEWIGSIAVEAQELPLVVSYPLSYPAQPPTLQTTLIIESTCPHVLRRIGPRTQLCWIAGGAALEHQRWNPQRHTAATVMLAGQRWLLAYLVWRALGWWPVADANEVVANRPQ